MRFRRIRLKASCLGLFVYTCFDVGFYWKEKKYYYRFYIDNYNGERAEIEIVGMNRRSGDRMRIKIPSVKDFDEASFIAAFAEAGLLPEELAGIVVRVVNNYHR
jgi:hypothetical protein